MKRTYGPYLSLLSLALALGTLLCLPSCSADDEAENRIPSIAGYYRFVSITSSAAVDLNQDGVLSTNLLAEIEGYDFTYPEANLELRPTRHNTTNHKRIDIFFPHPNLVLDITTGQEVMLYTKNALNGTGYTYSYDEKTSAIDIIRTANHPETEQEWGRLNRLTVSGTNQLEASISKRYYDFHTQSWLPLNITAVYEKVE
ncbi:hypothetical protein [Rufibacter psychrotolerans]|uniref:hypothetical protein n=1 Tax=Rufibacter psychrotolerans TaxID=2812556 RepID=UPI0019671DE8|nr:hypothetical protein [Rufibacter sp. SYSU D00308]